jgi:hypothetical protein
VILLAAMWFISRTHLPRYKRLLSVSKPQAVASAAVVPTGWITAGSVAVYEFVDKSAQSGNLSCRTRR